MFTELPLKSRYTLLRKLFKPKLYPEAFFAYYHRLPSQVRVNWVRDDGMIVGTISAGGKEFMTQGKNANEFIKMVNQSIATAFNVPDDYIDIVNQARSYAPPGFAQEKLKDPRVLKSDFGMAKTEGVLKFA